MTMETFLALLTVCAAANTLLTQAIKTALGERKYSSNLLAAIDAVIVGSGGTALYYYAQKQPPDALIMVLMVVAVWVSSMIGYDKIKQLVLQIGEATNAKN